MVLLIMTRSAAWNWVKGRPLKERSQELERRTRREDGGRVMPLVEDNEDEVINEIGEI